MKLNELKAKITDYKKNIQLLSLLVERISLTEESRMSDNFLGLVSITNEIELNEIWKNRQNSSFSFDYYLNLDNLNKYYAQINDLKIDADKEEKDELERLNKEIDLLITNRSCLIKAGNFNPNQTKFSILHLLVKAKEIDKVLDVFIDGSDEAIKNAIEALIDNNPYVFHLLIDSLNFKFSELNLTQNAREMIIFRVKKIFKERDYINDKDSYLYFVLGNRSEEEKYHIIKGINALDNEFLTKFIYKDKEKKSYLTSNIVVHSNQMLLGGNLFEEEMKRFKGEIPEIVVNTRKKIFAYLLENYKEALATYLTQYYHFICDLDDLKLFLHKIRYVSSPTDVYILGKILKNVDKVEATEILRQHNEAYDIRKIKKGRENVVDHLKVLSEHLLDTAPARSKVQDNIPANIQYTKK